jgi:azurin
MLKYLATFVMASLAFPALAGNCEQVVKSNDLMQFDVKEIVVSPSCKKFTVRLEHTGKLPKSAMGHNWVLSRDTDFQELAKAGAAAGLGKEFVPDDPRIIAKTKLLGGGESDSVTFNVSRLSSGTNYTFFCSFPGHWAMMKGVLRVGK